MALTVRAQERHGRGKGTRDPEANARNRLLGLLLTAACRRARPRVSAQRQPARLPAGHRASRATTTQERSSGLPCYFAVPCRALARRYVPITRRMNSPRAPGAVAGRPRSQEHPADLPSLVVPVEPPCDDSVAPETPPLPAPPALELLPPELPGAPPAAAFVPPLPPEPDPPEPPAEPPLPALPEAPPVPA